MAINMMHAGSAVGTLQQDYRHLEIMRDLLDKYTVDQFRELLEVIGKVNMSAEPDVAVVEYLGDFVLRYEDDFAEVIGSKFSDLPLLINNNERQKYLLRWRLTNGC